MPLAVVSEDSDGSDDQTFLNIDVSKASFDITRVVYLAHFWVNLGLPRYTEILVSVAAGGWRSSTRSASSACGLLSVLGMYDFRGK